MFCVNIKIHFGSTITIKNCRKCVKKPARKRTLEAGEL